MEILIALCIVTLCIFPLVSNPWKWTGREIRKLEELELERIADWTFTEIHEMFLKNAIAWEQIPEGNKTSPPFPLEDATISLPGIKDKKVARAFALKTQGWKDGDGGRKIRQIYVHIYLNKKNYTYRLPVQKVP